MDRAPIESLWAAVKRQRGPATAWHLNDLRSHHKRYLADLRLVAHLAPAGPIPEIGSAPCHMTGLLKLSGYPVVGVDLAPHRVAEFIAELDLDVRQCDIERARLPFADETFACALLCETFEHLRVDPGFVLSEINRVLVSGAPLLVTTPNVYSLPSVGRFLLGQSVADPVAEFAKLRSLGHMGHVREYSASEVASFVEVSGFAVQSLDYRSHANVPGRRGRLLRVAYRLAPRRMRREIDIIARKAGAGQGLAPLD